MIFVRIPDRQEVITAHGQRAWRMAQSDLPTPAPGASKCLAFYVKRIKLVKDPTLRAIPIQQGAREAQIAISRQLSAISENNSRKGAKGSKFGEEIQTADLR